MDRGNLRQRSAFVLLERRLTSRGPETGPRPELYRRLVALRGHCYVNLVGGGAFALSGGANLYVSSNLNETNRGGGIVLVIELRCYC